MENVPFCQNIKAINRLATLVQHGIDINVRVELPNESPLARRHDESVVVQLD